MINTIYLDMDGVLADFDSGYRAIYGCNCRDDPNKNNWTEFVENGGFANLNLMPGAIDLVRFVESLDVNIEILSCIGNRGDQDNVARQKTEWLESKGFKFKPNYTTTKVGKSDYAGPSTMLIDDSKGCVDPFLEKNGYAVLHYKTQDTIQQLECMTSKGLLCAR